jgi:hypothetical protein
MYLQNVAQNGLAQRAGLHREEHFDATVQVAWHQIRAPQEDFVLPAMVKVIDIIANNPIDQKVVELSSSQPYSLVELSMYRSVFPP